MNLDQWFRRKCRLKTFVILSSGSPFVQQSATSCAIFVEGIIRNNSVNYFKFGPMVHEALFKGFIWSSGSPPVQWSRTNYAISKEGIMGNIHVKLYEIRTSVSGGSVV